MCCYPSAQEKREFLADMKKRRRKTFTAWRALWPNGQSPYVTSYYYRPGINHAFAMYTAQKWRGKYDSDHPLGLHCYRTAQDAEKAGWPDVIIIPAECHVDDLVVLDTVQIVMRRVTILKKDWPKKWKVMK